MSGYQRYGLFGKGNHNDDNDAKLYKKYSPLISWGERVFYRKNETADFVYEITSFPQVLTEYEAIDGVIETKDNARYVDIGENFLVFNNKTYQFKEWVIDEQFPNGHWVETDKLKEIDTEIDTEQADIIIAEASSIWYWKGDKYIYATDFDCINITPITTTTDEVIGGALMKTQTVTLKTQYFNSVDDKMEPKRFDIIAWGGDLYIIDEQDTVPHYRPALVNDYLISMSKLL